MAAPDRFIAWCKQEQASIEQQLELLETGKVRTGEDIGAGWIDTTDESIARAKARLAELNDLLTEAGTTTVESRMRYRHPEIWGQFDGILFAHAAVAGGFPDLGRLRQGRWHVGCCDQQVFRYQDVVSERACA